MHWWMSIHFSPMKSIPFYLNQRTYLMDRSLDQAILFPSFSSVSISTVYFSFPGLHDQRTSFQGGQAATETNQGSIYFARFSSVDSFCAVDSFRIETKEVIDWTNRRETKKEKLFKSCRMKSCNEIRSLSLSNIHPSVRSAEHDREHACLPAGFPHWLRLPVQSYAIPLSFAPLSKIL